MDNKKSKILLTGAEGFLGRYVQEVLKQSGIKYFAPKQKELDILDKDVLISKTKNFKAIIHLAGNIRTPLTDSAEKHFGINSLGTLNVLEACRANKIPKLILASTTDIYGNVYKTGTIKESQAVHPEDFYGQSKFLAEKFCQEYSKRFGINFTILRITYLYGWGMYPSRVVSKIINSAIDGDKLYLSVDPGSFMDLLYVKDAARAVLLALKNKNSNKILNISSAKKTKIKDLVKIAKIFYPKANLEFSSKKENRNFYLYDNKLAKNVLKFKPRYDLKAGVKDYIKYLEANKNK